MTFLIVNLWRVSGDCLQNVSLKATDEYFAEYSLDVYKPHTQVAQKV